VKEERQLVRQARRGNQEARDQLVMSLMRYGVKLSQKYNGKGMDDEDYAQWAMVGILRSIESFDMKLGTRLVTHMHWCVRQAMSQAQITGDLIRIPSSTSKRRRAALQQRLRGETGFGGVEWDIPEVQETEILPPPKIMVELSRLKTDVPEIGRDQHKEVEKDSLWFMELLTARERLIIECRFFLKMTLQTTGERVGVSRERIRQIQARIFTRVRYAERNSGSEAERTRLFHWTRRSCGSAKGLRKKYLLSAREQVDQCFSD